MTARRRPSLPGRRIAAAVLVMGLAAFGWLAWRSGGVDEGQETVIASAGGARAPLAPARQQHEEPPRDDDARAREGVVLQAATVWVEVVSTEGDPVVGASVSLRSAMGAKEERTDESGLATFEGLWPGAYSVDVSATGFTTLSTREELRAGLAEAAWTFRLRADGEAPAGVRGVVRSAGAPVAGAVVAFLADGSTPPDGAVLSSRDGRFSLPRVSDADGLIAFHEAHGAVQRPLVDEGEIVLELPAPGFVEGRVVDDRGRPLPSFEVQVISIGLPRGFLRAMLAASGERARGKGSAPLSRRWKTPWTAFPTGAEGEPPGSFRVGPLPAGLVRVVASADGRAPAERDVTVTAGGVSKGVELRLPGPLVVTGCVTDAKSGEPVVNARVQALRTGSPDAPGFGAARTAGDGCYRLLTTAGLRHSVGVRARGYVSESAGGVFGRADEEVQRDFTLAPSKGRGDAFRYVGVGAKLTMHDDGAQVVDVFKSGSAAGALEQGDVILRVDGVWTEGMPLPRIVEMIVGEADTDVELLVQPKGGGPVETVVLLRQPLSSRG